MEYIPIISATLQPNRAADYEPVVELQGLMHSVGESISKPKNGNVLSQRKVNGTYIYKKYRGRKVQEAVHGRYTYLLRYLSGFSLQRLSNIKTYQNNRHRLKHLENIRLNLSYASFFTQMCYFFSHLIQSEQVDIDSMFDDISILQDLISEIYQSEMSYDTGHRRQRIFEIRVDLNLTQNIVLFMRL